MFLNRRNGKCANTVGPGFFESSPEVALPRMIVVLNGLTPSLLQREEVG